MTWFQKFMQGRNGGDQLSKAALVAAVISMAITWISHWTFFWIISYALLFYSLFRLFSRDLNKRRAENYEFIRKINPLRLRVNRLRDRFRDRKTYRYFTCPDCKATMRVPKGKGKVIVICPKCKRKLERKS